MEKRYIGENRYKKSSSRKRRSVKISKNVQQTRQFKKTKTKKKSKRKSNINNIVICVILLVIVFVISKALLNKKGETFISKIFKTENDQEITIGVITQDDLRNTQNLIVKEMNTYSNDVLIRIDNDYKIEYVLLESFTKKTNSKYELIIKDRYVNDIENIKNTILSYLSDKNSVYYSNVKNIKKIDVIDNKMMINLSKEDPYFIYELEIPLGIYNENLYSLDENSNANKIIYNRTKNANIEAPKTIIIIKYKDMYKAVDAYKNKDINMMVTSKFNVQNMLGKYEYNIKSYKNGEAIFLFLNPKSEIIKKREVRKSIAYSIDRDNIIKNVAENMGSLIDLPYIYDNVKYKYDIYAAENNLLTNGYSKVNKIYTKDKTKLELKLIVNKDDDEKVKIASSIKNNLSAIGINVNVEKLSKTKLSSAIEKGDYDLVLANVNLNSKPDISFLKDKLIMPDNIESIQENLSNLQNSMSDNISCIGIFARTNYLIYSKDIIGIDSIDYKYVLKDLIYNEQN